MQRIERGQRLQRLCEQRQRARIALALTDRLPAAGQPLLDHADLTLSRTHHAIDQRQPVFFPDSTARHRSALDQWL